MPAPASVSASLLFRFRKSAATLKSELGLERWSANLLAGTISGMMTLIIGVSFAALVFAGPLSGWIGYGIGLALLTAVLVGTWTALFSSFPATLSIPQDRVLPILALMAADIVRALPGAAPAEAAATVLTGIALASLATGICFLSLGWFRLGNLIRFIPYPVIGGFLAGSGWLLAAGSFRVMTGHGLNWEERGFFADPGILAHALPGVALGIGLLVLMRRKPPAWTVLAMILGSVLLFYLVLAALGIPLETARAQGWLLPALPSVHIGELRNLPMLLPALTLPDWKALFHMASSFQAVLITGVFSILLNTTALELAAERDIDLNHELRVAGVANLLSAFTGGFPGFISMSQTRLSLNLGGQGRLVGLTSAAFCGAVLLFGAGFLAGVPKFVLGGLLFFIGAGFLAEWLIDGWRRLPRSDYAVVVLILAVIDLWGYLQGVAAGVVAAAAIFVIRYSRVSTIASLTNGAEHRSNVDRSPHQTRLLREKGGGTFVVKLQGYVFFGSANHLLETVRQRAGERELPPLRFVLLDFRRVSGIDSSAAASLVKIQSLARRSGFSLLLSNVPLAVCLRLTNCGLDAGEGGAVLRFPDRDHGLEWCEDRILDAEGPDAREKERTLAARMVEDWPLGSDVAPLFRYLERLEIAAGEILIRQGDAATEIYFLDAGRLSARLQLSNGKELRLRTMHSGAVVGELGLYTGEIRSAHVRAETPCVVYRLTFEGLRRLEIENPEIAAAFHRFMARLLSERLVSTNRAIQALLE